MTEKPVRPRLSLLALGPAIITASVVLGPGSILSSSKIGYQFGYQMAWVLLVALALMLGMTALSARLGVTLDGTLCDEAARRAGRPLAVLAGLSLFLIASCFQFGNNLGVITALEPLFDQQAASGQSENGWWKTLSERGYPMEELGRLAPILVIVNLNLLIVVVLFGFKSLYRPIELMMKVLVGLMVLGFAGNLAFIAFVGASEGKGLEFSGLLAGFVPQLPEGIQLEFLPHVRPAVEENGAVVEPAKVDDSLTPVIALFATTFSIGGAFYQSYLVREKGWTARNLGQGLLDAMVGITTVVSITLVIMITAAAVLHGNEQVSQLSSAADVARQLRPLFGPLATLLFCLGIFAGAFSSFLVNAMIGGTILSDGLGLGGHIDGRWPKLFTVLALAVGMNVAVAVQWMGESPVNLIIFAQAMTVLGLPALAFVMLLLAFQKDLTDERRVPLWLKATAVAGFVIVVALAIRTAVRLYLELSISGG